MCRCSLHFVDCKWELTTCASKHSLVYAIDEIQISDKKWGCARDKGSKAEPEFNVVISIWGLCWCILFLYYAKTYNNGGSSALASPALLASLAWPQELWYLIGIQADITGLSKRNVPEDHMSELQEASLNA